MYSECPSIGNDTCTECYTGERDCPMLYDCSQPGSCSGYSVGLGTYEDEEADCLSTCQKNTDCNYYNFNALTGNCDVVANCTNVATGCPSCVWGQRECGTGGVSATRSYEILMSVGGSYDSKAEFTDLSGQRRSCPSVPNIPTSDDSAVGAFIDGKAIVCGGYQSSTALSECWTYDSDVTEIYIFFQIF